MGFSLSRCIGEALARRYRIAYSVTPAADGKGVEVTHSSAVYVFDRAGAARLLVPSLASSTPEVVPNQAGSPASPT